jgi:ABC-type phosphate transport system auxiliary subunit
MQQYAQELTQLVERFNDSDAAAFNWLEHRSREQQRLEENYLRLQEAVDKSGKWDQGSEGKLQQRLKTLKTGLSAVQVSLSHHSTE